ncbi:MAG: ImmA/IrrE family metallo-endopeptidase [Aestuariivita sp.]|nr:ImmA/IrrE family metallo-endopeptidase [Aestuariivita sp.]
MKDPGARIITPAIAEIEKRIRDSTGAPSAYAAMRRLCSAVVQASRQTEPPFRVRPLLDVLNVEFEYENTNCGAAEASVSLRGERLVLDVPRPHFDGQSGRYRRWRFSIAHEFAHILLIRTLGAKLLELTNQDKSSYWFVEGLCDHAASHLLLPRIRLTEILRSQKFSQDTVREIAKRFDTSQSAVLCALQDLLPRGAIFLIKSFRRDTKERVEPRVFLCSSRYSRDTVRPWLPRGCTTKHIEVDESTPLKSVCISLNKRNWNLEGKQLPWIFGPQQPDMFYSLDGSKHVSDNRYGKVIVCAEKGKFDRALFDGEETFQ